jgi:hypothetical protein
LAKKYKSGIEDLLQKGYAEKVHDATSSVARVWYLPHHPVMNKFKPGKVRIVFDCAAQFRGRSLNDYVFQGPDMTNRLLGVLLRFRQDNIALMADIDAMFYQVSVTPQDRDVLRFLWWPDGDYTMTPQEYCMTVHPFGGVWSPSCADYILRRTAEDNKNKYPAEVVEVVKRNFYVDDCLKAVRTNEEAIQLAKSLTSLLAKGGFHLSKWMSNSRHVIASLPSEDLSAKVKDIDLCSGMLPPNGRLVCVGSWKTTTSLVLMWLCKTSLILEEVCLAF